MVKAAACGGGDGEARESWEFKLSVGPVCPRGGAPDARTHAHVGTYKTAATSTSTSIRSRRGLHIVYTCLSPPPPVPPGTTTKRPTTHLEHHHQQRQRRRTGSRYRPPHARNRSRPASSQYRIIDLAASLTALPSAQYPQLLGQAVETPGTDEENILQGINQSLLEVAFGIDPFHKLPHSNIYFSIFLFISSKYIQIYPLPHPPRNFSLAPFSLHISLFLSISGRSFTGPRASTCTPTRSFFRPNFAYHTRV
ncbi:hypothetical protein DFH27DRAFT_304492 [Peziza echinospora]|nr:hypothetical protein DFH27DRAFT_304492 [Peziza echinospora]